MNKRYTASVRFAKIDGAVSPRPLVQLQLACVWAQVDTNYIFQVSQEAKKAEDSNQRETTTWNLWALQSYCAYFTLQI